MSPPNAPGSRGYVKRNQATVQGSGYLPHPVPSNATERTSSSASYNALPIQPSVTVPSSGPGYYNPPENFYSQSINKADPFNYQQPNFSAVQAPAQPFVPGQVGGFPTGNDNYQISLPGYSGVPNTAGAPYMTQHSYTPTQPLVPIQEPTRSTPVYPGPPLHDYNGFSQPPQFFIHPGGQAPGYGDEKPPLTHQHTGMEIDYDDPSSTSSEKPSLTSPPPDTPGSPTSTISGYYPGAGELGSTPQMQNAYLPYQGKGKGKGVSGSGSGETGLGLGRAPNPGPSGSGGTGPANEASSNKRDRDPHRKKIEYRAAVKRKEAVKKLQHVLAMRTKGLPENGLANQLQMAADQLEEDGKTILQLQLENKTQKKRIAELEKVVAGFDKLHV